MSRRSLASAAELIDEAARLICDEGYADYRMAKHKAAERLGLGRTGNLPDNRQIEAAVIDRQALFGGQAYYARLKSMRATALRAMKLLAAYEPRLAGSAVSGAIGDGHRVQIHLVSDHAEAVEILLHDRQIPFEQDERVYRLADGREVEIPLLRFEADDIGVDLAVFDPGTIRNPPLSQVDGKPTRRLTPEQLRPLVDASP
ncbi:hypothetical protein DFR24_2565 [Panacagrimonas perspica]|uniref:Nucleotidyltransferase-like protein n=1 Tax=Panacagrimonas perspica TaxID=381431 RepID=A0A4S3K060_9GAMM|nr:hypothetical protein [Panacagrimonas perspica]TDU28200.1 hypothetical protein DFR24_2565 [Panacagrimonas perspica]THD01285.1 hypothetical protein B1810_20565 [Panacagrimonas perspica]